MNYAHTHARAHTFSFCLTNPVSVLTTCWIAKRVYIMPTAPPPTEAKLSLSPF